MLLWESESSFSSIHNRNWIKGFESFPRYRVVWHFCWNNYEHVWYLSFFQTIWLSFFPHKIYNICAKMHYFSLKIDDFSTKLWIFGFNLKFLHIAEKVLHRHYLWCLWQISSMTIRVSHVWVIFPNHSASGRDECMSH